MATLDPSTSDAAAVAIALGTDCQAGLTSAEASRRLVAHGPNRLEVPPELAEWRHGVAQFTNPLVYLLVAAIVIAVVAWIYEGSAGVPVDAFVIGLVVLANGALGYVQESRARSAVAALAQMTAATSTVVRDGRAQRVRSVELVPGDLLQLAEGDAVGADARLLSADSLMAQEASLTGESASVLKSAKVLSSPAATGDRLNMVFSGTAIAQGVGRAVVTGTGMSTEMGSIATLLSSTQEQPTPLQREVARIGQVLAVAVLIIAALVVASILLMSTTHTGADVIGALLLGVSLAVAAVPEGLPSILTLVLALGVQRMARRNAIVKKLSSVETLGCASVIASDKTGTLTQAKMTVVRTTTASGTTLSQSDRSQIAEGALRVELSVLLSGGSLASNASLESKAGGGWSPQGDAGELAFLIAEHELEVTARRKARFSRIAEIPFTSDRKMMSTIHLDHERNDARVLFAKGAPDVLLGRCTRVRVGSQVVDLTDAKRAQLVSDFEALTDAGLRTLAVAYRYLPEGLASGQESELIYAGTAGILDPPRPEATLAIRDARNAGIRVIMITGDHPRTAVRIGVDLGIQTMGARAVTGLEMDQLDEGAFADVVRRTSIYARVAPAHKLRIVRALQADGNVVAMTGDGVNDAPALKAADIGVAMGLTGTEVTKEAARMILADDNFATIVEAVREGREIFDNLRKAIRYLLISNMGEVLTVFFGVVLAKFIGFEVADGGIVLPLLATQLLWINLVTDAAPALALGLDPASPKLMLRRPRGLHARIIDRRMWLDVVLMGVSTAVAALLTMRVFLHGEFFAESADFTTARTAGFTVLVFASLFTSLASRSDRRSVFAMRTVNWWLWGAVALSVLLQVVVVEMPFLNATFRTTGLTLPQWLLCVAMASAVLWCSELRKLLTYVLVPAPVAQLA